MLHWLHPLLPHIVHYGYVFVFVTVFINNIGVPLPGKTILLGAGFILGKAAGSLWEPMVAGTAASILGGICAFALGRRLDQGSLERIHWLHLTPKRVKWPQRFFKRHGMKAVLIARFIPLFPPAAANLLAGMAKLRWRIFLIYTLTGSAVWAVSYILIGYFFGKKWEILKASLGPTTLCLIAAGLALIAPAVFFRHSLSGFLARHLSRQRKRKPRARPGGARHEAGSKQA